MEVDSLTLSQIRAAALNPGAVTVYGESTPVDARSFRTTPKHETSDIGSKDKLDPQNSHQDSLASTGRSSELSNGARRNNKDGMTKSQLEARGKPNSDGTQKSGCTEPLSQWAYEHGSNASRATRTTNQGSRRDQSPHSYKPGESGYVAFDSRLEGPIQDQEKLNANFNSQDVEKYGPISQVEVRTELFPETHRFKQPKTPATSTSRRDFNENILETPKLPANPFGNRGVHDVGDIGLSQVFNATQGLSSPALNGLRSEPSSDKPSPGFLHQRPSSVQPSSPLKLERSSIQRSATAPYTEWNSAHKTQDESPQITRKHSRPRNSPLSGEVAIEDLLDPDVETLPSEVRRKRQITEMKREARNKLKDINAKPRPGSRPRQLYSPVPLKIIDGPVIVSDDSGASSSEAETEHEEIAKTPNEQEQCETGEDNKENLPDRNIQVPRTTARHPISRYKKRDVLLSSPIAQRRSGTTARKNSIDGLLEHPSHLFKASRQDPATEMDIQLVAIADSQLSQESKEAHVLKHGGEGPPISSDGSRKIVRESQGYKNSLSSPTSSRIPMVKSSSEEGASNKYDASEGSGGTATEELNNDIASSPPIALPMKTRRRHSPNLPLHVDDLASRISAIRGGELLLEQTSSEKYSGSSPPKALKTGKRRQSIDNDRTLGHNPERLRSTVPESTSTDRFERQQVASFSSASAQAVTSNIDKAIRSHYPSSAALNAFKEASSQLSSLGQTPPEPSGSKSLSKSPRVIQTTRPKRLMEIAEADTGNESNEDLDFSFNLMTEDDLAYKEKMDKLSEPSSPIDPRGKRKRRIARKNQDLIRSHLDRTLVPERLTELPSTETAQPDNMVQQGDKSPSIEDVLVNNIDEKENLPLPKPSRRLQRTERERQRSELPSVANPAVVPPRSVTESERQERGPSVSQVTNLEDTVNVIDRVSSQQVRTASIANTEAEVPQAMSDATEEIQADDGSESAISLSIVHPTRILAHFTGSESGYFAATCCSFDGSEYRVRFDDGNTKILSAGRIKRFELRRGDEVRLYHDGCRKKVYVVQDLHRSNASQSAEYPGTDIYGNDNVVVIQKPGKKDQHIAPVSEVFPIDKVYCTITMWSALRDREYTHPGTSISAATGYTTPSNGVLSPNKYAPRSSSSVHHTPMNGTPRAGIFSDTIFVMTAIANPDSRKVTEARIKANGGTVLDTGFDQLFALSYESSQFTLHSSTTPSSTPSTLSSSPSPRARTENTTSSAPEEQFRLRSSVPQSSRTLLIADKHSRNTKYFQALALGIPCLHTRWVRDCVEHKSLVDWRPYLLAAGESAFLDGAVVSRWLPRGLDEDSQWSLRAMVDRRNKWLDGRRVLLVSSGGGKAEAYIFIALALGAKEVGVADGRDEARAMLRAGSDGRSCAWDWVCVDEDGRAADWEGAAANVGAKGRPAKRRRSGKNRGEEVAVLVSVQESLLTEGLSGVREVGTEFVVQSLILGRLIG